MSRYSSDVTMALLDIQKRISSILNKKIRIRFSEHGVCSSDANILYVIDDMLDPGIDIHTP